MSVALMLSMSSITDISFSILFESLYASHSFGSWKYVSMSGIGRRPADLPKVPTAVFPSKVSVWVPLRSPVVADLFNGFSFSVFPGALFDLAFDLAFALALACAKV